MLEMDYIQKAKTSLSLAIASKANEKATHEKFKYAIFLRISVSEESCFFQNFLFLVLGARKILVKKQRRRVKLSKKLHA
jgi:hypothetical protein